MIQINVVGSVSERDEIIDIQTAVKLFAVAKRMIGLTDAHESETIVVEPPIKHNNKNKKQLTFSNLRLPVLTVKGFN